MGFRKKRMMAYITGGVVLILAFIIVLTVMLNMYSVYVDGWLGKGTMHTVSSSGLSTDYNTFDCSSTEEATEYAHQVSQETAEEGMILLRNDEISTGTNMLPLAKNSKVTLLGYNTWHNVMSNSGDPSTIDGDVSIGAGLEKVYDVNSAVTSYYAGLDDEIPASNLSTVLDGKITGYTDTAIITISRYSGEFADAGTGDVDGISARHSLTLTNDEINLVDYACKNFNNVIMVINSANTFELNWLDPSVSTSTYTDPYDGNTYDFSKIRAAIWAGCCGSQGGTALAEIMDGDINPSGHTPDTYIRKLTSNPTYANFGDYEYTNSGSLSSYATDTYFVEYEEDIYVGYRYYETAAYEASKGNYDGFDYDSQVIYPFGYGLSYTTFSMEYAETPAFDAKTDSYTFKVKVTNTGSVAGKGVAQIYVSQPYSTGDAEKSYVQLVGFAKTQTLEPNASETLTINVASDYFTTYDYITNKCYVLDAGTYKFYLSENAHSWADIEAMSDTDAQAKLLWTQEREQKIYNNANDGKRETDETIATNKMDDSLNYKFKQTTGTGDGYVHDMSRSDFKSTYVTSPAGSDYVMSNQNALDQVKKYSVWLNINDDDEMPVTDSTDTSYTLADMRGVDFDDEKWDEYISQFSVSSMANMFCNGMFTEQADEDNGAPAIYLNDGPSGWVNMMNHGLGSVNQYYCGAPMVAATFNVDIAWKVGDAMAEEAWNNDRSATGMPVTGLYGWGCNIHRSAFGGRNYEYYSEDPVLSGKMAASAASAASEKGVITYMKHFALNEQELHRQDNGICTYVNEQAFREIYVRAFEIYMKEASRTVNCYEVNETTGEYEMVGKTMTGATGLMSSYNRIGATWAGASNCIPDILRDEFGFTGTITTDAGGGKDSYMNTDQALRATGSLILVSSDLYDTESATAVLALQQSTKYMLFNRANSNILMAAGLGPGDGIYYDMSPWRIALICVDVFLGLVCAAGIVVDVLLGIGKINPKDKYKPKDINDKDYYM